MVVCSVTTTGFLTGQVTITVQSDDCHGTASGSPAVWSMWNNCRLQLRGACLGLVVGVVVVVVVVVVVGGVVVVVLRDLPAAAVFEQLHYTAYNRR